MSFVFIETKKLNLVIKVKHSLFPFIARQV